MTIAPPSTADGYVVDIDYIPGFYPQLAPTALRHVAALNRLRPPALHDGFRYLELGCGLGRSLTTLAAAHPQGRFVGVDINARHAAAIEADVAAAFHGAGLRFAGSLPVHTNFWDLCVKPEFQELFRTTSDRLVTEAHKDFCANTAFRWDVYAKDPRPLATADDRLREADDLHYGLTRRDLMLPYQANLGVVTSTVRGPLYQALIDALRDGGLRLSELLARVPVGAADRDGLVRAADAGVALGMFEVTAGAVPPPPAAPPAAVRVPLPFNRMVMEAGSLGGRPVALASRLAGTGLQIGDLDALMLLELAATGRDGMAGRVAARLAGSGRSLQQDDKPVTDAAACQGILAQASDAFLQGRVPQLVAAGAVDPA